MSKDEPKKPMAIKLRKNRRSVIQLPSNCGVIVIGSGPQDGKPYIHVDLPDGATVTHESLTTVGQLPYDSPVGQ
jgi:hypothetical protein